MVRGSLFVVAERSGDAGRSTLFTDLWLLRAADPPPPESSFGEASVPRSELELLFVSMFICF